MSNLQPLLDRNQTFAADGHIPGLSPIPNHQVFVLTCMDSRIDPAHFLGVGPGDALVMRNSGGRVTSEVIEEVVFIASVTETMLGENAEPFEVAIVHHTGCGTGLLADDTFREQYASRVGADAAELSSRAVLDPHETVRADVDRLRASPLLPANVSVSGHVYDVDSGVVTTVVSP